MNRLPVPRLYVVTDRAATGGRPLAAIVEAVLQGALRGGVAANQLAVQLREKDLPAAALRRLAGELREITGAFGAALYVNDRIDVALAVGADGVHLAGTSLSPQDARSIAPALRIAISAHAPADLDGLAGVVDFAVFGPIRDTPSKRVYGPPVGMDSLRAAVAKGVPLVAIGGLSVGDVPAIDAAGAGGLACIRPLMAAEDPAMNAFLLGRALAGTPDGTPEPGAAGAPVTGPHQT